MCWLQGDVRFVQRRLYEVLIVHLSNVFIPNCGVQRARVFYVGNNAICSRFGEGNELRIRSVGFFI